MRLPGYLITALVMCCLTVTSLATDVPFDWEISKLATDKAASKVLTLKAFAINEKDFKDKGGVKAFSVNDHIAIHQKWFKQWKSRFNKKYASAVAEQLAFKNFQRSAFSMLKVNSNDSISWFASLNQFSDLAPEQAKRATTALLPMPGLSTRTAVSRGLKETVNGNTTARRMLRSELPKYVNWDRAGKMTKVKDQRGCGSCWAYSASTCMEAAYLITKGIDSDKVDQPFTSVQQLLSCATSRYGYNSRGCSSGMSDDAMSYASRNKVYLEQLIPDRASDRIPCDMPDRTKGRGFRFDSGPVYVKSRDPYELMAVVAKQPVVVYLTAAGGNAEENFWLYGGGVYESNTCGGPVNHGVVVYGYKFDGDFRGDDSYWLVRNSWATSWGEKGNMRIKMEGPGDGMCNMYSFIVHPPLKLDASIRESCLDGKC